MLTIPITIMREEVRQHLINMGDVRVRSEGFFDNTWFRNEYSLIDLDIYHDFEAPDLTEATTTFTLTKPVLVLYVRDKCVEGGTVDTRWYSIEFQVAVNFEPSGVVTLQGYLDLLRVIVNPRDKKWWLRIGLAPRSVEVGPVFNGGDIKSSLKDRLLIQSLMCEFSYIGAE